MSGAGSVISNAHDHGSSLLRGPARPLSDDDSGAAPTLARGAGACTAGGGPGGGDGGGLASFDRRPRMRA